MRKRRTRTREEEVRRVSGWELEENRRAGEARVRVGGEGEGVDLLIWEVNHRIAVAEEVWPQLERKEGVLKSSKREVERDSRGGSSLLMTRMQGMRPRSR